MNRPPLSAEADAQQLSAALRALLIAVRRGDFDHVAADAHEAGMQAQAALDGHHWRLVNVPIRHAR